MTYAVIEFITHLIETFLFAIVFNKKCARKDFTAALPFQTLYLLAKSFLITILITLEIFIPLISLTSLLLNFLFLCLFFQLTTFCSFFWAMLYNVILLVARATAFSIPYFYFTVKCETFSFQVTEHIIFRLIYISIVGMIISLFLLLKHQLFTMKKTEKIVFTCISIIFVILEELILCILAFPDPTTYPFDATILAVFLLVFLLFFLFTFCTYQLGIERDKNQKLMEEIAFVQSEQAKNEEIIASVNQLRAIKHDIKTHLSVLYELISDNHMEDSKNYIQSMNASIEKANYTISTGILSLDCILSSKFTIAYKMDISVEHALFLPKEVPISPMDFCSIIGNILDNAIEANQKVVKQNRKIFLEIKPFHSMLSIMLINSSCEKYHYSSSGSLKSTHEAEFSEHGIGINRIQFLVKKYNGLIKLEPKETEFKVHILIPLEMYNEDYHEHKYHNT